MSQRPETQYALVGDAGVAYQLLGDGPFDLVLIGGWADHVELQWEHPPRARFLERLASFSRLICFDRRGVGLSDPVGPDDIILEVWMEDLRVVMDAAGSKRAALLGYFEGGQAAIAFSATFPEQTSALVLVNTAATLKRQPDYPWGMPPSAREQLIENFIWAVYRLDEAQLSPMRPPGRAGETDWYLRTARHAGGPAVMRRLLRNLLETDVRPLLPAIQTPTLVLHRMGETLRRIDHARYLAANIDGAKLVELLGAEEWPWAGNQEALLDEVEEFLTGVRPSPATDRVLTTVLFTDIVSSSDHIKRLGDKKWAQILDEHDALAAAELERFGGLKVNPTGDGLLARFDGPARAVRCARAMTSAVRRLGIEIRSGVHTGEIELRGEDIAGTAVYVGQRVSALAGPGEVLVSRTVVDLVAGSGLEFSDRGEHELKGIGTWQLYSVAR